MVVIALQLSRSTLSCDTKVFEVVSEAIWRFGLDAGSVLSDVSGQDIFVLKVVGGKSMYI